MPKTPKASRLQVRPNQALTEDDLIDYSDERVTNVIREASLRFTGGEGETLAKAALARVKHAGKSLPMESSSKDPGYLLELMWRFSIRTAQPKAAAMYEEATKDRSFRDPCGVPTISPEMLDPRRADRQMAAVFSAIAATGQSVTALNNGNEVVINPELLQASIDEGYGDCNTIDQHRQLLMHMHVITNVRPHGFASVGKLPGDSPLAQLLLHGLQLFMAGTFDDNFRQNLDRRHRSSACIYTPDINQFRTAAYYDNSARTPVPPAAALVPVFDHCSLHCQLMSVSQVVEGLLLPDSPLPPDSVYCWSAFNKLLGLGLIAPMEEAAAAAAAGDEPGGSSATLAAAAADLRDLAAARQVDAAAATSLMAAAVSQLRVSLHDMIQQQQQLGAAAMQDLAARQDLLLQQQVQHMLLQQQRQPQCTDLPGFRSNSSSSSSSRGHDQQQQQQQRELLLQSCLSIAWSVQVLPELLHSLLPQRLQRHTLDAQQDHKVQEAVYAAAAVTNPQDLVHAAAAAAAVDSGAAAAAVSASTKPEQLLDQLSLLLLLPEQCKAGLQQQHKAAGSEITAAAAAAARVDPGSSASSQAAAAAPAGLEFQAFLKFAIDLLLQRLLAQIGSFEQNPKQQNTKQQSDTYIRLLQVLLDIEQLKSIMSDSVTSRNFVALHTRDTPIIGGLESSPNQQQQQQRSGSDQAQSWQQQLHSNAVRVLCSVIAQMRNLAATTGSSSSSSKQRRQRPAAAAAFDTSFWRSSAVSLYNAARPAGWSWLGKNFDNVTQNNTQPGFWGLIRYFLAADALNLRRRVDPDQAAAAASMWSDLGWQQQEFEPMAMLSKQAARVADKASALQISTLQHDVGPPIDQRTLQQYLRLACLAGNTVASVLPYADPTPAAAAAARSFPDPVLNLGDFTAADVAAGSESAADLCPALDADLVSLVSEDAEDVFIDAGGSSSSEDREYMTPAGSGEVQSPEVTAAAAAPVAAAAAGPAGSNLAAVVKQLFKEPRSPKPAAAAAAAAQSEALSQQAAAAQGNCNSEARPALDPAAAAARWQGPALHLADFVTLGPMFLEQQQGPCLAQLLRLIAQYYADHAAAAAAAAAVQQGKVRKETSGSRAAAATGASLHEDSSGGSSRLMVLLLGCYHLKMWQRQQQRRQQQQVLAHRAAAAAAAGDASVYSDLDQRLSACDAAVAAAGSSMDLLLYCTVPDWARRGSSSSGSSSVGDLVNKLSHDYVRLVRIAADDTMRASDDNDNNTNHHHHQQQQQQYSCRQQARAATSMLGLCLPRSTQWRSYGSESNTLADVDSPNFCDGCSIDLKQMAHGVCFLNPQVKPRPKDLAICADCGAAMLCSQCYQSGDAGKLHKQQHCRVLQDLWQQRAAAAAPDQPAVSGRLRQHGIQAAAATAAAAAACRCAQCRELRMLHVELLLLRSQHTPLQLLLLPQQQQQQQHLYLAHAAHDSKVSASVNTAYREAMILHMAHAQYTHYRDEAIWRQRLQQQQQRQHSDAASNSTNTNRKPASGSSSSSSRRTAFGSGLAGLGQQQQQQQYFGAGLSDKSLFGRDYNEWLDDEMEGDRWSDLD